MTVAALSLVKETSTTTGTGSYTLAGAATNYLTFQAGLTPSSTALVVYTARMEAVFERGIGLLSAGTTLQRIKVVESTNSNNAVNWAAGTKEIYCDAAVAGSALGKHNVTTTAPVPATHNYTLGYAERSEWVVEDTDEAANKTDDFYVCTRAGVPGSTTATWVLAGSHALNRLGSSYSLMLGYNDATVLDATIEGIIAFGMGAKARWPLAVVQGHGYATDYGEHQTARIGMSGNTTNATPTKLTEPYLGADNLGIEEASTTLFDILVVARDNATPDSKTWTLRVHVDRVTTGDPSIVGQTKAQIHATGGAAAWDIAAGIDTTDDGLYIEVTGAAAKTIRWTASITAVQAAFT